MVLQHSKLLIDDHPLQVLPRLAVVIGLNEAIVLQQVHYWLKHSTVEHAGRKWVYNTYEEWQEGNFPFWSTSTIGRIFRKLEDEKLLLSKRLNKASYDHTKYYTIDYNRLASLDITDDTKLTPSDDVNLTRSDDTKLTRSTITETTTETTAESNGNGFVSDDKLGRIFQLYAEAFGNKLTPLTRDLVTDLADDVTVDVLYEKASVAAETGKSWAWVVAAARGKAEDTAKEEALTGGTGYYVEPTWDEGDND